MKKTASRVPSPADFGHGDLTWFQQARFGLFLHWGLYALPARHEWVQNAESIPAAEYRRYFEHFNPDLFDPVKWARAAKAAGMKYFVITAKHHEGFCLWDTQFTDYKITKTPFGRDALREIVEAFRAEGLRIGIYYSLLDWHHPDFIIDDRIGPYRNQSPEQRAELNRGRKMSRYARYMRDQVTELLTGYGKIDVLWFDFSYPCAEDPADATRGKGHLQWESEKLVRLVRSLQPDIILDNRLDLPGAGDIFTPEQYTPDRGIHTADGRAVAWEGCQTFSGSWGYYRDEVSWKNPAQCLGLLIDHVSRGGNLLMNVGPTARGEFDPRALDRLTVFADWMKYHARAIEGCGAPPACFPEPRDCRLTWNPVSRRLYLHILNWPFGHLTLENAAGKIDYMQFLHDASEVRYTVESNPDGASSMAIDTPTGAVTLRLPTLKPPVEVPVIEIFLKPDAPI